MECDTKINLRLSEIFQIVFFRGTPLFLGVFQPVFWREVKTLSADGSVGSPHVRVGHRQDLFMKSRCRKVAAFFMGRNRQINVLWHQALHCQPIASPTVPPSPATISPADGSESS
jgi:hypothetical protein